MDEHDKRAREVWDGDPSTPLPEVGPLLGRIASALRSTAAAAVAAERKGALPVIATCNDCASYRVTQGGVKGECGRTGEWLCDAEDGAPVPPARCPLRRAALAASPAQAERVSEEGWAANAERQLTRNGGWHVPGYSEDEHAVRFETVTDAHARGCRETQVRIAARLRARAATLEDGTITGRSVAADLLRAEADALEEGS